MIYFPNKRYFFEATLLDDNGNYLNDYNLNIQYKIVNCENNNLLDYGIMGRKDYVYYKEFVFSTVGQYRIEYISPDGFYNDSETILVENIIDFTKKIYPIPLELKNYSSKQIVMKPIYNPKITVRYKKHELKLKTIST